MGFCKSNIVCYKHKNRSLKLLNEEANMKSSQVTIRETNDVLEYARRVLEETARLYGLSSPITVKKAQEFDYLMQTDMQN